MEDWEDIDYLFSEYGTHFLEKNLADRSVNRSSYEPPPPPTLQQYQLPPPLSNDDDAQPRSTSAPAETKKDEKSSFSLETLELLKYYASGFKKKTKGERANADGRKLSTEEIMRVAGERYIQLSTQNVNDIHMLTNPFGSALSGLSEEEAQDVELAHLLLAAADKVGYQQYERGKRLLTCCERLASEKGNHAQRIVHYFSRALQERIDKETGRIRFKRMEEKEKGFVASLGSGSNLVFLKFYQELPFSQVTIFSGVQAMLENMRSETQIHLIDLQIRNGVHWIVLMQALADRVSCPVKHLKITAVGTKDGQNDMAETGKMLGSFAESLNLPFLFKVVLLSDTKELREEHFEVQASESVAIFCKQILRTMINKPDYLENLMGVIRTLNPSIMVLIEVEANHNSPSFFNRFIEALFFFSALFDCLEDCSESDDKFRVILGRYFWEGIHNTVAAEGKERFARNVNMSAWRAFFVGFGMVEIELSETSMHQASLIAKQFPCGSSCTLQNDGKGLVVGWKGTPILSLSIWKFS